ncbi:MAG: 4Fe-4S binding protein [Dehalococcoidales bacterium]|nr:4Fe-4S binding protein [Limnochordia bacterium]MDD2471379.1 4Fe-4S binding protein [Dehalococcoidales bacterium]MDD4229875.1 4Fe-4S binding protein [Dehalococcoidales bacterium]MDD4465078.1 4Fe-4S binding protein [Dehalococcoidales bacterium]MDD5401906.1 4Fe-4S binding protein [Dehalococcoidales bacterium]
MNHIVNINSDLCTGCGACVSMCPAKILFIDASDICRVTDENKCDRLGGCERTCPTGAISIAQL